MCSTGQGSLLAHGTNDSLEDVLRRCGVGHRLAQREICGTHVPNELGTHDTLSYVGDDISAHCGGAVVGKPMQVDIARVRGHRHGISRISIGSPSRQGFIVVECRDPSNAFARAATKPTIVGGTVSRGRAAQRPVSPVTIREAA